MFHHPMIFPATKENKRAIQRARELINVAYPIPVSENESINEERKQLLTKLNSLDGRLLTFQEKKDLEALINQLTRRVTGMKSILSNLNISGSLQTGNITYVENQFNNNVSGQPVSCSAEKLSEILKQKYLGFTEIKGLFGNPFALEREYINLQMICHTEVEKEKNQDEEKKLTNNGRLSSYEDLFGGKQVIKPEDLFKSDHESFPHASKKNSTLPTLLLIQGRAGIGKTTFLHYVSREWAEGKLYNQYRWVFKLTCRELRTQDFQQLKELKVWEWVYHSQFSASDISKQSFEKLWDNLTQSPSWLQGVLFCIDGYDELPGLAEDHPCKAVLNVLLTGEYKKVHKIITSRPYGVAGLPKERRDIEVIGFTDENITRYLQTYFPSDMRERPSSPPSFSFAKQLRDDLKQNPILWGIAHIPVNLNLICGIMERMQKKDLQRKVGALGGLSQLYQAMEAKLLERIYERDKETKSLKPLSTIAERSRKELLNHYQKACCFLARLAFEGIQESQIILSRDLLNQVLEAQLIEDDREFLLQLQEIGFIKPILDLAIEENEQDYEFIHLTFQEYYAAKHIVAGMQADQAQRDQMRSLIIKERYNPRWQIVWWFVAGLLRQNDETYTEYIRLLQAQDPKKFLTGDLLQHYGLGLLARCLDEGLATNEKILPIMNESISLLQASVQSLYLYVQRMNSVSSSALIESLRLSSRLRLLSDEKDLYSQIGLEGDASYVQRSIRSIGQIRVATPKVLGYLKKQLATPSQAIHQEAADAIHGIGLAAATPDFLAQLAKLLSDGNNSVCRSAAYAVRGIGVAAATSGFLEQLANLLSDKNDSVRGYAVDALRGIGAAAVTTEILTQLAKLLSDENDWVRGRAVDAVRAIGAAAATPDFLEQLAKLLRDKNDKVRGSAAEAVRGMGPAAATPDFLAQLANLLRDKNDKVRGRAVDAVRGIGSAAATPGFLAQLAELLSDKDHYICASAAYAIHGMGSAAATSGFLLEQLAKLLSDKNDSVREYAADAVRGIGAAAATEKILAQLANLLSDKNDSVRGHAVDAVRGIGAAAATTKILAQLAKLLSNENDSVRRNAADAVRGIGAAAATTDFLEQLAKLLRDKNDSVRGHAAKAVRNIASQAATPNFLAQLAELLRDENNKVSWNAAEVVGGIGSTAATPGFLAQLANLLGDKKDYVRCSAAYAVCRIGSAAATSSAILEQLAKLLDDEKDHMRFIAVYTVRDIGPEAATTAILEQLAKLLSNENINVRRSAADAVRGIGSKAATTEILTQLAQLLSDKKDYMRCSATYAVCRIGSAAATPAILEQLAKLLRDKNDSVRESVVEAVRSMGSAVATTDFLAQLAKLLSDDNGYVRKSTAEAVRAIGSKAATTEILTQLAKLLSDDNNEACRDAAEAVCRIGSVAATLAILAQLAKLLRDKNVSVRESAVEAVRSIGSKAATPEIFAQLVKLLSDTDFHVRKRVAETIRSIGSAVAKPEIFNQLVRLMLTDSSKYWDDVIQVLSTLIPAIFTDNLQQWARQPAASSPSDTVDISLISIIIGAYLTGYISCQVVWDADQQQYMVSGFVHTQGYSIPINKQQAQWLCQTVPWIIEQLSQGNTSDVLLSSKLNTNYNLDPHPSNSSHISQQNNLYSNKERVNTLSNKTKKRKHADLSTSTVNQENHHRELKLLPKASEEVLPTVSATSISQALFSPPSLTRTDKELIKKAKDILDRIYPEEDANNDEDIKVCREERLNFLNGFKRRLTKADKDKINDLIKELGGEELSHEPRFSLS